MRAVDEIVPTQSLVIGIGSSFRSDDRIGLVVIERLLADSPDINAIYGASDPISLLAQWEGYDHVVMVDAVVSGAPAGTIQRIDLICEKVPHGIRGSTHGAALADAVALAEAIDRLPEELVLLGVEPELTGNGEELSASCAAVVGQLTARVKEEITCTRVQ